MTKLLEIKNLTKRFVSAKRQVLALDHVSFDLARKETLALVGPSGSGKSTLARLILRLSEPDEGEIQLDGVDLLGLGGRQLRAMRKRIQIVFQDPHAALNPRATIARVLDDPLRIQTSLSRKQREIRIAELLGRVGLDADLAQRSIHDISGGQLQRVAIARALASDPELIVLDEAVSALDVSVRADILRLLKDLQQERDLSYLFITHDLGLVRAFADRAAILDQGRFVEIGSADEITSKPQSEIGQKLLQAAPRLRKF